MLNQSHKTKAEVTMISTYLEWLTQHEFEADE
jgi:hypothetical protein